MKNALLAVLLILIGSCRTSTPDYTSKIDQKDLPANEAIVHLDVQQAIAPDVMSRFLLKEAARAAIDRGGIYFRVDEIVIGPIISSTPRTPIDRTDYDPSDRAMTGYDQSDRTMTGMTPTEAAIEATIIALLSINTQKQRSGSLHMTIAREPLSGDHVFDAGKVLDAIREGGELAPSRP